MYTILRAGQRHFYLAIFVQKPISSSCHQEVGVGVILDCRLHRRERATNKVGCVSGLRKLSLSSKVHMQCRVYYNM